MDPLLVGFLLVMSLSVWFFLADLSFSSRLVFLKLVLSIAMLAHSEFASTGVRTIEKVSQPPIKKGFVSRFSEKVDNFSSQLQKTSITSIILSFVYENYSSVICSFLVAWVSYPQKIIFSWNSSLDWFLIRSLKLLQMDSSSPLAWRHVRAILLCLSKNQLTLPTTSFSIRWCSLSLVSVSSLMALSIWHILSERGLAPSSSMPAISQKQPLFSLAEAQ